MKSKSIVGRIGSCGLSAGHLASVGGNDSCPRNLAQRGEQLCGILGRAGTDATVDPRQKGTTNVMYKQQVVCPTQDFANA